MRRALIPTLYALAMLGLSCSLVGLDDVNATECALLPRTDFSDAHALCAEELSTPLNECEAYVCALRVDDALYCTVAAPDADGDGVGDAACVPEGTPADCDESDPTVAEGMDEACDGKDNDCDGNIDEGVLVPGATQSVDAGDIVGLPGFASGGAAVPTAYRRDGRLHVSGSMVTREASAITVIDPGAEAAEPGFAVAADNATTVVFPAAGCGRLAVGSIDDAHALSSTSFDANEGIPDSDGEAACGVSSSQRAPAIATVAGTVGVAWLASDLRGNCGTGGRADVLFSTGTTAGAIDTPTQLGTSNDLGPPAIAVLPGGAFATVWGDAREIVVRVSGSTGEARVDVGDEVDEVAIAVAPARDSSEQTVVSVAYAAGCGGRARVGMQRFALDGDALSALGEAIELADGEEQRQPAIAFGELPEGFLVAWREGDERVRARVMGRTDGFAGDVLTVLDASDFEGTAPRRIRGSGIATLPAGGFEVVSYAEANTNGIFSTVLTCSE